MNHQYKDWFDSTGGLKPLPSTPDNGSFNNIVFTAEYLLARVLSGRVSREDEDNARTHVHAMVDRYGLYKPKNSHDNITALILVRKILRMPDLDFNMEMVRGANYHPKHVIVYAFLTGNVIVRNVARMFLFIPAIAMIYAAHVKGKFRQDQWMINDGKILQQLKLAMLSSQSLTMRITGRICRRLVVQKYKSDYFANMLRHYFRIDHPCVKEWRLVDDDWLEVVEKDVPRI